ncbi:MAG TPA: ABC transporter permease [Gemmatimonadales bacterium]|nr:ABC transporter permease [Gemmatimonadales bacterium]
MAHVVQDLRFAFRSLRKHPGYTLAALLTLGGGIGAVTAILSVVNGVILRPLPYPNANRALLLWEAGRANSPMAGVTLPFSGANFADLRDQNQSLEYTAAFRAWPMTLSGAASAELLNGAKVSAGFFEALGVAPFLGRTFSREDDRDGAQPVAILSHAVWRTRFGAEPGVIGNQVKLNDVSYTVVGVMPPGFAFPRGGEFSAAFRFAVRTDVWTPIAFPPSQLQSRGTQNLAVLALPKTGVTREAAAADLELVMQRLEEQYPVNQYTTAKVEGLMDGPTARVGPALLVLLGAVGFLLILACANVANLLLTRTLGRAREVAVRTALGAPRSRILAQFLTENLVLSIVGGLLGVAVALVLKDAVLALAPERLPRLDDVGLDWRAAGFIVAVVLLVGTLLGIISGANTSGQSGIEELRDGARTSGGPGARRMRNGLVIVEVALSVMLLAGAGALGRTFVNLRSVKPGFEQDRVLTAQLVYPLFTNDFSQFARLGPEWRRFYHNVNEAVASLPGVRAAGVISSLPLSGAWESTAFGIAGRPPANQGPSAFFAGVSEGYFATLGIPLLRGRLFDAADRDSARSVIISAALAAKYFPNEDPLGQQLRIFGSPLEIVGIVGDVHQQELSREAEPALYLPLTAYPAPHMTLVVRGESDPMGLVGAIREQVRAINPAVPVTNPRAMADVLGESLAQQRFSATLVGFFAVAALALAMLGLYGVISFGVARRTREIGVRLAIGAAPGRVLGMVIREGLTLGLAGVGFGLLGALAVGRILSKLVFGVSATDPLTLLAVGGLLAGVAVLASWIPARRAMRMDPAVVLRAE